MSKSSGVGGYRELAATSTVAGWGSRIDPIKFGDAVSYQTCGHTKACPSSCNPMSCIDGGRIAYAVSSAACIRCPTAAAAAGRLQYEYESGALYHVTFFPRNGSEFPNAAIRCHLPQPNWSRPRPFAEFPCQSVPKPHEQRRGRAGAHQWGSSPTTTDHHHRTTVVPYLATPHPPPSLLLFFSILL